MSRFTRASIAAGGAMVVAVAITLPTTATAAPTRSGVEHTCAQTVRVGYATCFAQVRTENGHPMVAKAPDGYGPKDITSAYALNGTSSGGKTVAIVDAYNDPTAEADLKVYRKKFNLPACSTANGCFTKVNQRGGTTYPPTDAGWATEISLDLDMVSATCPDCKILLVEADTPSFGNLGKAVDYAATQHPAAISNSYGGSDHTHLNPYKHPGIAITASTGDGGYGVESPASFKSVIAVGGTSLVKDGTTSRGWTETAWNGAGSGCSTLNSKPSWQTSATQCSGKANADVSAVADPYTGVAVYDSTPYQGYVGWQVYGGTSASSPIIASVYALGGNLSGYPASYTWAHTGHLNDVTAGTNGVCVPAVWCTAGTGWDGPTGLGTPNGTGSF